jgi:protein phosphatase
MIPVKGAHLQVYALTDSGRAGKNNEDNHIVSAYQTSETDPTPSLVAIVADGVGGHQAGEVASSLAVESINQVIAESDASKPVDTLERAFIKANESIYAHSIGDSGLEGMSTTASCAWIIGRRLFLASIGDSRIYLMRDDRITKLTVDHTWVQEAIESGIITPEEARTHPNAHMIRRHLGSKQPAIPDFRIRLDPEKSDAQAIANQGMLLGIGEHLILCSDGLTDLVSDEEIQETFIKYSLQEGTQKLIDLANRRGGHDNITIIAIQVSEAELIPPQPKPRSRRVFALIFLVVIIALLAGGWLYWVYLGGASSPSPTPTPSVTAELSIPTVIPTAAPPTQVDTPEQTAQESPTVIPSPTMGSSTSIPATYTPWPTSTSPP